MNGFLIDYLIPAFYLTDVVLISAAVLLFFGNKKKVEHPSSIAVVGTVFLSLLLPSLFLAPQFIPALYRFSKIGQGVLLFLLTISFLKEEKNHTLFFKALSVAVVWVSVLGILQFILQRPIFGYFPLGETQFQFYNPGIAKITLFDKLFFRTYSVFPHPNILAGFLAISLTAITYRLRKASLFTITTLLSGITALTLTFSRTGILTFVAGITAMLIKRYNFSRNFIFTSGVLLFLGCIALQIFPVDFSQSVGERSQLLKLAFSLFKQSPFFGVGLNHFSFYSQAIHFQPVHHIFALTGSESGLLGFIGLCALFFYISYRSYKTYKMHNSFPLILLFQLIILGSFDHYLLTIHQGIFLFWLTLAIIYSYTTCNGSNRSFNETTIPL